MAILIFNENFGTTNNDNLMSGTSSTTFGLSGDDVLSSVSFSEYNVLAGGSGDDTYIVGYGSATNIVDTGGSDRVIALSLGFNDPDTYVATVDGGKHILTVSTTSGTQLGIANWQISANSIESITFSDGTYSLSFILSVLYERPNYIGDLSTAQLVSYGLLPHGTTSSDLLEFINYVSLTELSKISELTQVAPSATNSQSFSLSVIVDSEVLSEGPVYLDGLNETLTYNGDALISHTVEYTGTVFNYVDIDNLIMTVTRDGEFTQEFSKEISDFDPEATGISYQTAVQLIGVQNIGSVIISVAGADGSYVF